MLNLKFALVTHRRGRGWRGGYLGSAVETYLLVFSLLHRPLGTINIQDC